MNSFYYIKYKDLKSAIIDSLEIDVSHDLVWHRLEKGEEIEPHIDETDETIILNGGQCLVLIENRKYEIDADSLIFSVHIPKGKIHSFRALSAISYLVIKEKKNNPE